MITYANYVYRRLSIWNKIKYNEIFTYYKSKIIILVVQFYLNIQYMAFLHKSPILAVLYIDLLFIGLVNWYVI